MPDDKSEKKERGPVNFLAFVEGEGGHWWLAAADREATSAQKLRTELLAELEEAGHVPTTTRMVIVPTATANVIEHTRVIEQRDTFTKATLTADDASPAQPAQLPPAETEAGVSARMAASPAPADAIAQPADTVGPHVAAGAESASYDGTGRNLDGDFDEATNPDIDPLTGVSRRTAAQATPADEGTTVFPIEGDTA